MPTTESLRETLGYFKQQRDRKLQEAKVLDLTIQQLERELGDSPTSAEIPINIGESLPPMTERVEVVNGKRGEIRPDEFFRMTHAEAAKKYLKRIGHAVSFEELVNALQAGGCKVGGENPKRVLYISLIRNTRDFVPPQQGWIGLREFYPGADRPIRERPEKAARKRGRPRKDAGANAKTTRPPKRASKDSGAKPKPQKVPSPIVGLAEDVLSDKQTRSLNELVTEIGAKLGHSVGKVAVMGALRNRKFQNLDGKYSLVK